MQFPDDRIPKQVGDNINTRGGMGFTLFPDDRVPNRVGDHLLQLARIQFDLGFQTIESPRELETHSIVSIETSGSSFQIIEFPKRFGDDILDRIRERFNLFPDDQISKRVGD